jgi:hypothetical protein
MNRVLTLSLAASVVLAASAQAGGRFFCFNHGVHCIDPPPPSCPAPGSRCDKGPCRCSPRKSEKARRLIEQLHGTDGCCERIRAARKLGCRLHADYCCDPEVLGALIGALQCDRCWEVRRQAAWSIAMQKARTEEAVLALYVASKLDPHFLVRDRAAEALGILIVCRRACFKDLFRGADELIKELRKKKYRPGSEDCRVLFAETCAACGAVPEQ